MTGHHLTPLHPPRRRYLVLGGACLDTFATTPSVALGGKNSVTTLLCTGGGGGLNVATGLAAQDPQAEVLLLAGTGDDAAGALVRAPLTAWGVAMPWGVVPGQPTSTSFIVTEPHLGWSTIFCETGVRAKPVPLDQVEEQLPTCDVCWLGGPTCSEQIRPIVALAARLARPVFLGLGRAQIELGHAALGELLSG